MIEGAQGTRLGFVVTTNPDRAALVRAGHPGVEVLGSTAEAVAAGAEVVVVSTPAATHTALTDDALDLGAHVVWDKPFALDAAAAEATVRRARAAGRLLSPYQNRRWDSDLLTLRRVLAGGELGDVVRFESAFERWEPTDPPAAGAGCCATSAPTSSTRRCTCSAPSRPWPRRPAAGAALSWSSGCS